MCFANLVAWQLLCQAMRQKGEEALDYFHCTKSGVFHQGFLRYKSTVSCEVVLSTSNYHNLLKR